MVIPKTRVSPPFTDGLVQNISVTITN